MQIGDELAKKRQGFRQLLELIREDYRAHYRDWTLPGFRAVAMYRLGAWVDSAGDPACFMRYCLGFTACFSFTLETTMASN